MRAFAQADRFVSEVEARKLRPVYTFVGDEAFFRKRCRDAILQSLVPHDLREFSLYEFDLADTDLAEVLDRARTPSLMAPFQVFFVRGVKNLGKISVREIKFVQAELAQIIRYQRLQDCITASFSEESLIPDKDVHGPKFASLDVGDETVRLREGAHQNASKTFETRVRAKARERR